MKKALVLSSLFFLLWKVEMAHSQCQELFFSEYLEGSASNKCLEIYNPTATAINLADSAYTVNIHFGSSSSITSIPLEGIIPTLGTFALCHANASANIKALAQQISSYSFFNGDDAITLTKNNRIIDAIGQIGNDPGTAWTDAACTSGTANETLRRKQFITSGDTTASNAFQPSWEWECMGIDNAEGLGSHQTTSCNELPSIAFFTDSLRVSEADGTITISMVSTATGTHTAMITATSITTYTTDFSFPTSIEADFTNSLNFNITIPIHDNNLYDNGRRFQLDIVAVTGARTDSHTRLIIDIADDETPPIMPPGSMAIVGYDTWTSSGGHDLIALAMLRDMPCNSSFWLVNIVFEAKAQAYERTNRWYNGNGNFNADLPRIKITYQGLQPLAKGSIISIALNEVGYIDSVMVNGARNADFVHNNGSVVQVSGSQPDALLVMQGEFSEKLRDNDNEVYRTFEGRVVAGLQSRGEFQPFSLAGANAGKRVSRLPPDIACTAINLPIISTAYYGYYNGSVEGPYEDLLYEIANTDFWQQGMGDTTVNVNNIVAHLQQLSIQAGDDSTQIWRNTDTSGHWYDCKNWRLLHLPDSTMNVAINQGNQILIEDSERQTYGYKQANCKSLSLQQGHLQLDDTLKVYGNWEQSAPMTLAGTGLVSWRGSQNQVINAPTATVFSAYELQKDTGNVYLQAPITISEGINFNKGKIVTGLHDITFMPNAVINGGNTQSFVEGKAIVTPPTAQALSVPVGQGSYYMPAEVQLQGGNQERFRIEYHHEPPIYQEQLHDALSEINPVEYWNISPVDAGSTAKLKITLPWKAHQPITTELIKVEVAHFDANAVIWEPVGQSSAEGVLQQGKVTSNWVTDFSPFTIGIVPSNTLLPIRWQGFELSALTKGNLIQWKVLEEETGTIYIVERSENGQDFEAIGEIMADATASGKYQWLDITIEQPHYYYRIVCEGTSERYISPVKELKRNIEGSLSLQLSDGAIRLSCSEQTQLQLIDLYGRVLWGKNTSLSNQWPFPMLPKGVYILRAKTIREASVLKIGVE